jgi:hypothetical protein
MEAKQTRRVKLIDPSRGATDEPSASSASRLSTRTANRLLGPGSPDAVETETRKREAKVPAQFFEDCLAAEQDAVRFDLDKVKFALGKIVLFEQPLFEPAFLRDDALVTYQKQRYLKICRHLWQGSKYCDILDWLRRCRSREDRLYLIAWWLKAEKVCEPEGILGAEEVERMTKKKLHFLSRSEFEHADRVRVWLPYFKRLLKDSKNMSEAGLVSSGYEERAVKASLATRSAVQAACNWLAKSPPACSALTLRNAFSRVYGPKRMRRRGYPPVDNAD